jgi:hypothetical protein
MVRFPALLANLASWKESEDVRTYDLEQKAAQKLGLSALESGVSRTVKQIRRVDGTFGNNLFPKDYPKDIISPSDDLRVWGHRSTSIGMWRQYCKHMYGWSL